MRAFFGKNGKKADKAASVMKMTAEDLKQLEVIEKIFPEPKDFTVENMDLTAQSLKSEINSFLTAKSEMTGQKLLMRDMTGLGDSKNQTLLLLCKKVVEYCLENNLLIKES